MSDGLALTINNLVRFGRCPTCYGKVRYKSGFPSTFQCKSCKARLERQHVASGSNQERRVNGFTHFWFDTEDIEDAIRYDRRYKYE